MAKAESLAKAQARNRLKTENADLRSKLEAAEGRIERARAPRESRRRAASSATRSWSASAVRTANTSWEPSPTGGGAELGWQERAGELAEALGRASNYHWGMHYPGTPWKLCLCETCESKRKVLARYHAAVAQHSGEPHG